MLICYAAQVFFTRSRIKLIKLFFFNVGLMVGGIFRSGPTRLSRAATALTPRVRPWSWRPLRPGARSGSSHHPRAVPPLLRQPGLWQQVRYRTILMKSTPCQGSGRRYGITPVQSHRFKGSQGSGRRYGTGSILRHSTPSQAPRALAAGTIPTPGPSQPFRSGQSSGSRAVFSLLYVSNCFCLNVLLHKSRNSVETSSDTAILQVAIILSFFSLKF
jgi:hypothetical protein